MKRMRWLALVLIPLVAGCDVAVGVYFATRKKSSSSRSAAPAVDTTFSVWVADLSAGVLTDADVQTAIIANGGQPTAEWTRVGGFTRTTEVDLSLVPGTWDAVLISATSNQKYLLDSMVILNGSGDPLASFTAPTFSDRMLTETEARNLPDGRTSETDATATQKAFLFKRFPGPIAPISRLRVDIWDLAVGPASGDTAWRRTVASPGEERSGGMGVFAASPVDKLYVSYRNVVNATEDNIEVLELGPNGGTTQTVPMENTVTGKVGAPSLAVMAGGDVIVAHSVGAADLRVRRFNGTLSSTIWNQPISNNGTTAALIEPNSISLDASDNVILVGGYDFGVLNGGFGHYMQRLAAGNGALWGVAPLPPVDAANSYWRGVVTAGADDIFAAGDRTGTLPSTSLDTFARKTSQSSTGAETWGTTINGAANQADVGHAVGVGPGAVPPVYVGGSRTVAGQGLNAILHKLESAAGAEELSAAPWPFEFNGSGNGDDEILSLVVEGNVIYATGYETTATQGRNLFVVKLDVSGVTTLVLWKRTFDAGVGDDRGVSLKTTPTHVFVSGDVNVGAGDFDIFVWKLLK